MSDSGHGTEDSLDRLLTASLSEEWASRMESARGLGDYVDSPAAFQRLVALLDDPNVAVIEVATRVLVTREGRRGLIAAIQAMQESQDNSGYFIRDSIIEASVAEASIVGNCRALLLEDLDESTRSGVTEILDILT